MSGESPGRAAARIAAAFILFGGFLATWILVQYRVLNVSRGLLLLGGLSAAAGLFVCRVATNPAYTPRARRSMAQVTGALFLYIGAWLALNSLVKPLLDWSPSVQAVLEGLYLIGLSGLILWSIPGARGLEKRVPSHTQGEASPPSPAKPIHLSRQAAIVNNYLMFGGAVCWMGILAAMCGDWTTVVLVSGGVLTVPWLTLRAFAPRYWRVTLFNVVGAAALSLLVVNVRWHAWMEAYRHTRFYEPVNDLPLWAMDVLLLVLFAAITGGCALKDRRPRASLRNQPGKGGEQ